VRDLRGHRGGGVSDRLGVVPWLFLSGVCQAPEVAGFAPGVAPHITLDALAELPPLPAAVEVVLCRITQEALTNASSVSGRIRAG